MPLTTRQRAAWHEAGHVAAAFMLDIGVRRVTIIPDETTVGRTHVRYPRWWRNAPYLEITPHQEGTSIRYAIMTLAGPVAEARKTNRRNWRGARGDLHEAGGVSDMIDLLSGGDDAARTAAFDWLWRRAELLLARPVVWGQVEAVAAALLARGTLQDDDIREVRRSALDPWVAPSVARARRMTTPET